MTQLLSRGILKSVFFQYPRSTLTRAIPVVSQHCVNQANFTRMAEGASSSAPAAVPDVPLLGPVVGVIQMTATPDKEANYNTAEALLKKAHARGAQMVFLPEAFDVIGESRQETLASAEPLDGPIITQYRGLASKLGIWLSLGGFHEKPEDSQDGRILNTHIVVDNNGIIKARYSKTHLFDVDIRGGLRLKETDWTIPGQTIGPPVQTCVGNVGLGICYDMRFPELSISLAQQGADILTYPSAFTVTTGMAHWETLLRARAIENQCYVIAAAQVGKHHAKRSSYGHSMIVDPWGCIVAECSDKVDVIVAELDMSYLKDRRKQMPVWNHRRHDIYGHITNSNKGNIDEKSEYPFGQYKIKSSSVFFKSALSYGFVNRKPVLPGHVLVSPLRPSERFSDLTPAEVSDLFMAVQTISRVIEHQYGCTSLTVAVQDGPEAGQTVTHVHVHILPRKHGDFSENDHIYTELEKHDKNVADSQWRTDEDMKMEAKTLRPFFS